MDSLPKSLRTELRYQLWSRTLFWLAAAGIGAVGMIFLAGFNNAHSTAARFNITTEQARENGISLADAMSLPVVVAEEGGQSVIDNPLRFDYEVAYHAALSLEIPYAVGTGLETASLLVFPWLFFMYGCFVAVADVRQGMLKLRVAIEGSRNLVMAKCLGVLVAVVSVVTLSALLSLTVSGALQAWADLPADGAMTYEAPAGRTGVLQQLAFSVVSGGFFALLGLFTGLATRSFFIPSLAVVVFLMIMPFTGAWDPRNVMITAAGGIFNFWGGFHPRAAFPVDVVQGAALYTGALGLLIAVSVLVWNRRSKFA